MNAPGRTDADIGPQLGRLLGPLRRALLRRTRAAADLPDLPEAQIEMLRMLVAAEGATPRQVAEELKIAPSTVSNLVRSMVSAGLVERTSSTTDLRGAFLTAAPLARDLLDRYDRVSAAILHDILAQLDAEDRNALACAVPALTRLLDALATH